MKIENNLAQRLKQGPVKINSQAVITYYNKENGLIHITDSLGNNFEIPTGEISAQIKDQIINANNLSQDDFTLLEPWIQGEHKGIQEYTLEEEPKNEMPKNDVQVKSEKMLLPTYF